VLGSNRRNTNRAGGKWLGQDPDRADWIEEINRSIADLDRYRLNVEASGYHDMAKRLEDQIYELKNRVRELQRAAS
jgi:predicted nuclease with TOPRIM domain